VTWSAHAKSLECARFATSTIQAGKSGRAEARAWVVGNPLFM
jgi:hypothetical protein